MDFAGTRPADRRIVHVDYYQLVEEPAQVLSAVYNDLDMEMPETVREGVVEWHRRNPKGRRGRNTYSINAFGLDADEVAEEYGDYIDYFAIPRESGVVERLTA